MRDRAVQSIFDKTNGHSHSCADRLAFDPRKSALDLGRVGAGDGCPPERAINTPERTLGPRARPVAGNASQRSSDEPMVSERIREAPLA
jgi:hypothetical protein